MLIRGKMADRNTQTSQLESQLQLPPESENPDLPPVTENPAEPIIYIWTNDGVNLREEPNTDCTVLATLGEGTKLELLDQEEEGWAHVSFDGQEGYVSMDFITDTDPSGEETE
jgi:uncharacterized protein YgiM (DUF1202 family)